jgi:hypothetical protein
VFIYNNKPFSFLTLSHFPLKAISMNLLKYYHQKNIFSSDSTWFSTFYLLRGLKNFTSTSRPFCMVCVSFFLIHRSCQKKMVFSKYKEVKSLNPMNYGY